MESYTIFNKLRVLNTGSRSRKEMLRLVHEWVVKCDINFKEHLELLDWVYKNTFESYDRLFESEKRIYVAELCGWTNIFWDGDDWVGTPLNKIYTLSGREPSIPDYLNDLNAMHEAEKIFIQEDGCVWGKDWETYCKHLEKICFLAEPTNCLMRATASQRAKAFVLTFMFDN